METKKEVYVKPQVLSKEIEVQEIVCKSAQCGGMSTHVQMKVA